MAELAKEVGAAFAGIPTPHLQPDGRAVRAHVVRGAAGTLVSDGGETVAAIRQRVSRVPQRVRLTIEGICRMNDLSFQRGTIAALVEPGGDVQGAIDRLGRACARIARLKLE